MDTWYISTNNYSNAANQLYNITNNNNNLKDNSTSLSLAKLSFYCNIDDDDEKKLNQIDNIDKELQWIEGKRKLILFGIDEQNILQMTKNEIIENLIILFNDKIDINCIIIILSLIYDLECDENGDITYYTNNINCNSFFDLQRIVIPNIICCTFSRQLSV